MDPKFEKPYDPKNTEDRIYKLWEDSGFFTPEKGPNNSGKTFSMSLPPPNVTGKLHIGHSAMLVIQDILARFHRMTGDETLWLPGTDHAAIATQSKVEKLLYKEEGKTRHDLGREEFLKRVEDFAQKSHDTIISQTRKMGASLDWSREAYTLDEKRNLAVRTAFKKMYDDGLIFRKNKVINWDPKLKSTVSDDEVIHEERKSEFYTFTYSKDFPIPISTTRPETKLGDTAVAVHPSDTRYKKFIGNMYDVIFCGTNLSIKIISDENVDKEVGTGAVGVTPAHSLIDYELAEKHDLPVIQIIDEDARMMVGLENIKGKKTHLARDEVVKWIEREGLLRKKETIENSISKSERSGAVIEPLPKLQWFINVNKEITLSDSKIKGIESGEKTTLKEIMRKTVDSGQIEIIPDRFSKIYFNWINNLRDWCISRQLWYGHRIPVWYRGDEIYVDIEPPQDSGWEQDPDTLDTWFSSGLWTFSTLGWPENTADMKKFHPTDVLETAYDILFFWVARMILMTGYLLGDIPFHTVYLHGLVRDSKGVKMSKSLDNTIDPAHLIEKFGTDATRMSLIVGIPPGNDNNLSEDKVKAYKHFANKIWNVSRFVMTNTGETDLKSKPNLVPQDENHIKELDGLKKEITKDIENFSLYLAGEKLYHYFWHTFADKIVEECKGRIQNGTAEEKLSAQWTLMEILKANLIMLHPFMPFVTEEIWGSLPGTKNLLIIQKWP